MVRTSLRQTGRSFFNLSDRLFTLEWTVGDTKSVKPIRLNMTALEDRLVPDGRPLPYPTLFVGSGHSDAPQVRVLNAESGELKFSVQPFGDSFKGGNSVASADFNNDTVPDLLVGAGKGGGPRVRILNGINGSPISSPISDFWAYDLNFTGGVEVAAGDVDGDGRMDAVTVASTGGGPRVRAFSGATGEVLADFFAYESNFKGGLHVALGDFNIDGKDEIVVAAGAGGGPRVSIFTPSGKMLEHRLKDFFAFDPENRSGVYLAVGDVNGDADWLLSFLEYLDRRGHARLTIQLYLREAELFGLWLRHRRRRLADVTDRDARAFVTRPPRPRWRCNARSSTSILLRHLREVRRIPLPPAPASPRIEAVVAAFDDYLRDAAGLAEATRLYCRRYAREFLRLVFAAGPIGWDRLRPSQVHRFIAGYGQSGRIAAARVGAGALHNFLRWLEFQGHVGPALARSVPRFPRWRLAALPSVLSDHQLAAIINGFEGPTATGRRDTAMALCLIDLGLRVGEVAALTLDDMDLSAGTFCLEAGKPRRSRILPMTARVRRAILRYLRSDRAAATKGPLFVRHRMPVGEPVSRELIRGVLRRAYARVAGCERLTGTHILRHTAASRLLRAGADLKRIADILGHRSVDTTAIYAKVDVVRLAAVAMPWPAAKEVQ